MTFYLYVLDCYPWDKTNRSKAKKRSRILYDKDKNNNEQELIEDESNLNICQKDLNNNNDGDNCIRDKSQQSSTTFKGDCCHKENDEVSRSICETMEMSTEKKGDTSVDDSMEISEGNVQSTTKDINVLTENSKEDNRISVRNTDERKSILNEDNDMSTRSIGESMKHTCGAEILSSPQKTWSVYVLIGKSSSFKIIYDVLIILLSMMSRQHRQKIKVDM